MIAPLAAIPLVDTAWRTVDAWLTQGQVIPEALLSLRHWQAILLPAIALGAVVGLFWPVDRFLNRSNPWLQRLYHLFGFGAFGLLCGFAVVFVREMVAPMLAK